MNWSGNMLIRKLFRTACSYKAQFISMVIMIAIGVGVFLGFNIEWKSLENDANTFLENTKYADYRIYSKTGFTKDNIDSIKNINGVEAATRYFYANVGIKDTNKSLALNVSENYSVSTMLITSGAEYNEQEEGIWLSDKFAEKNNIKIGDKLSLIYKDIEISDKVIGLVKSGENMICVADENQLMPDYEEFGFAYISPKALEKALGTDFYPQINIISNMKKSELESAVKESTGTSFLVTTKDEHFSYAGVLSETEEGKTMGSVLPVLFLAIAVLTMVTTMHRIAENEKVQIGTLKALGFRDKKILFHYTSYGFFIGLTGLVFGIVLGYLIASLIISPHGMMSTYIDMPNWDLIMPVFCIPIIVIMLILLTLISFLSIKKMLKGTAAEALRPYTPKKMKKCLIEKLPFWHKLSFGIKWNIRDVLRHKTRSAMTLIGVIGCTILLIAGLGMKNTMNDFLGMMNNDVSNYTTKITLSESSDNNIAEEIAKEVDGDWQASTGISYNGETISLEVYNSNIEKIRFFSEKNKPITLKNDGAYLCLRLKDTVNIGDIIEISPYGSKKTYKVKVAGYFRSLISESIVMTDTYAESLGFEYRIDSIYTDKLNEDVTNSPFISAKQNKQTIMDSYDTFMSIMNIMIALLIIASIILAAVVLYNLGIMSYVERCRELATLKILGFRDKHIGRLLINQNIWLTIIGVITGIPLGIGALQILLTSLAGEYELRLSVEWSTYIISIALTLAVSLLVGLMLSKKNKKINMVEALKASE